MHCLYFIARKQSDETSPKVADIPENRRLDRGGLPDGGVPTSRGSADNDRGESRNARRQTEETRPNMFADISEERRTLEPALQPQIHMNMPQTWQLERTRNDKGIVGFTIIKLKFKIYTYGDISLKTFSMEYF